MTPPTENNSGKQDSRETVVYEVWVKHGIVGETMFERFLAVESARELKDRLLKLNKNRPVRIIERVTKFTVATRELV